MAYIAINRDILKYHGQSKEIRTRVVGAPPLVVPVNDSELSMFWQAVEFVEIASASFYLLNQKPKYEWYNVSNLLLSNLIKVGWVDHLKLGTQSKFNKKISQKGRRKRIDFEPFEALVTIFPMSKVSKETSTSAYSDWLLNKIINSGIGINVGENEEYLFQWDGSKVAVSKPMDLKYRPIIITKRTFKDKIAVLVKKLRD